MRSDKTCRTAVSSALIELALRQFSTARPSATTPIAKIATPIKTSYRAKALKRWSAKALKWVGLTRFHGSTFTDFNESLPCCILRNLCLCRQWRVIRCPQTSGAFELNNRGFTIPRWPEYPFRRMVCRQCCWQGEFQQRSRAQTKYRRRFGFLVFCKTFRTHQHTVFAPNNNVRSTLSHTSLVCLAHKIVESIQGLLQSLACDHAGQAGNCQHEQQHQDENGQRNLD